MTNSRSDSASRAREQRYRHLFQHVPICIFVADLITASATIVEANRRAELVYGYAAAEFAGMPAAYLIPEEARAAVLTIVQRVQQGQTVTAETTNQRRDCTCFPVRIVAAPDPTDTRHMMVTVEDITAEVQRRSEAEAIDAERHRIAHEIHDGVAQSLAGVRATKLVDKTAEVALWDRTGCGPGDVARRPHAISGKSSTRRRYTPPGRPIAERSGPEADWYRRDRDTGSKPAPAPRSTICCAAPAEDYRADGRFEPYPKSSSVDRCAR